MTIIQFVFGLVRSTGLPVNDIDRLEGEASEDYKTMLATGANSKHKPVQMLAEHAGKWYTKIGLVFLFLFVNKWFLDKVTALNKPSQAESELDLDDDDLFLDDLNDDDE
jgi:hypothetical protein